MFNFIHSVNPNADPERFIVAGTNSPQSEQAARRVLSGAMSTVLVVEDETLMLLSIREHLAAEGYEVLTATNADDAIEILESRNDIRTVFTDIHMPGSMDGLKLAAAVRDRWPPISIIVTSGNGRPRDEQMPENTQFIGKPYDATDVLRAFAAANE